MPSDFRAILAFAMPLGLALAAMGSAAALGRAVSAAMEAMGRQPEAAPRIQLGMVVGCAFIEMLTIYVWIIALILQGRLRA